MLKFLDLFADESRFAGSGDRAAIGNIVYDCLRKKSSTQYLMGSDSTRRLVFGTLLIHRRNGDDRRDKLIYGWVRRGRRRIFKGQLNNEQANQHARRNGDGYQSTSHRPS